MGGKAEISSKGQAPKQECSTDGRLVLKVTDFKLLKFDLFAIL